MIIKQSIIGHRGASGRAPENTASSFRLAKQCGIEWVEFDVSLSKDNQPVVFHDQQVNLCTDGSGLVSELTLSELKLLDAGNWFNYQFAGEKILSLKEALSLLNILDMSFNLELKIQPEVPWPLLVEAVSQTIKECELKSDRVIVSCFNADALIAFHESNPEFKCGILLSKWQSNWLQWASSVNAVSVHCHEGFLTPDYCREIKAAGFELFAYTVNDPKRFQNLQMMGVDAVFSDCPDLLMQKSQSLS